MSINKQLLDVLVELRDFCNDEVNFDSGDPLNEDLWMRINKQ